MIKVNYDITTGEIKGYYPDDIGYKTIPEPYIEITEEQHIDCINHQGQRKVDVTTKKLVEYIPPGATAAELKQREIAKLNATYPAKLAAIRDGLMSAQIMGKSTTQIASQYTAVLAEYKSKMAEVLKGA